MAAAPPPPPSPLSLHTPTQAAQISRRKYPFSGLLVRHLTLLSLCKLVQLACDIELQSCEINSNKTANTVLALSLLKSFKKKIKEFLVKKNTTKSGLCYIVDLKKGNSSKNITMLFLLLT